MVEPRDWGAFPKCEANYGLVLGPFWELPPCQQFTYFAPHESKIIFISKHLLGLCVVVHRQMETMNRFCEN
jgi:hypothetical protein